MAVHPAPRLRDDLEALTALVQRAARHLKIDQSFVEKDFWVTELLRAVSGGTTVNGPDGKPVTVRSVFKGGTSLSRVYHLTNRFSEDVDLLIPFPDALGTGTRDRALKQIVAAAQEHLGLPDNRCLLQTSTKGVKRNVEFHYPRAFVNPAVREHLLLEMGSRGGPDPRGTHTLRSMIAEYAEEILGEGPSTWEEFAPVSIDVLAPERTLLEKCALLHDLGERFDRQDPVAVDHMGRAGRHYYDLAQLLGDGEVRAVLAALGSDGIARVAQDIDDHSARAGWRSVARPNGGYGDSLAFDPSAACQETARVSFGVAMGMVYADTPTFERCLEIIRAYAHLL